MTVSQHTPVHLYTVQSALSSHVRIRATDVNGPLLALMLKADLSAVYQVNWRFKPRPSKLWQLMEGEIAQRINFKMRQSVNFP